MGSRQTHSEPDASVLRAVETLRDAGFVFAAPPTTRLLTVDAAADRMSVSASTIRAWVRRDLLPGATMLPGGDLRIPVADLERIEQTGRLRRRNAEVLS
jgi:excisionase family DNA binding protein